ncbi:MAG: hypothetical protein HDT06_00585 [Bacteroidales bacterium]|nr:hypothetical protein [Bacteroidales bacterium]
MKRIFLFAIVLAAALSVDANDIATLLFGSQNPKNTYIGQMADNGKDKTGTGMQLQKKGNVYIGDFSHGKMNGLGMIIAGADGEIKNCPGTAVYVGKWINGKKEGKGTCYGPDGDIVYSGTFSDDMPVNPYPTIKPDVMRWFTTLELANGEFYIGEVQGGVPDGFGLFMLNNGPLNIGRVNNGARTGASLLVDGPGVWELVKWETPDSYTTITSSREYAQRKSVYNEVKSQQMQEFRRGMTEVFTGMADVAAEYQAIRAEHSSSNSGSAYSNSPSSGSSSSQGGKSRTSSGSKKADCGSAWHNDSRSYSDLETQLVPNGARTATDESQRRSIKSKMRSIRQKWEARGCPITKSPYED